MYQYVSVVHKGYTQQACIINKSLSVTLVIELISTINVGVNI